MFNTFSKEEEKHYYFKKTLITPMSQIKFQIIPISKTSFFIQTPKHAFWYLITIKLTLKNIVW